MSEQDNHIDELFEKAKKTPPVLSLSEVKDMLKEPAVRKNRANRRWIYFSLSCFVALVLVTLYKYSGEERRAKMLPHFAVNTTPPSVTSDHEQVSVEGADKNNIQPAKNDKAERAVLPVNPDVQTELRKDSTKLSVLDTTSAHKSYKPVNANKKTEKGIMIPWFADQDMLKVYQDKMAASGIVFEIKEVLYVDNTPKLGKSKPKSSNINDRDFISSITANISVNGVFYKSIQVNNFKEIRINWETSSDGTVKIKSLTYLDENFMSRKL